MTFRGTVRNGKVELEPGADLPEGAPVTVDLRSRTARKAPKNYDPLSDPAFRIGELAVPFGRKDGSREHDHYAYGTPKRSTRKRKVSAAKTAKRKSRR
jgi:hypothetical protein